MKSAVPISFGLCLAIAACGGGEPQDSAQSQAEAPAQQEAAPAEETVAASADNWIEYEVTGTVSASAREDEIMICSITEDDRFLARSLGTWIIDIDSQGTEAGTRSAEMVVAAPTGMVKVEGPPGRDVRFRGEGTITVTEAGRDAMGMRVVEVEYSSTGLANWYEQTIDVSGSLKCPVLQ
jgi:hypothetical protein